METVQELMSLLGTNVKTQRVKLGLTQEQLSVKVDVSKNAISEIERGKKFARAETLFYLAKAFDTEVYELLKPENVKPDKAEDIIAKYADDVRNAVGNLEKKYTVKIKKKK
jgi:transcriptional regulator with XRE-family HTH domain